MFFRFSTLAAGLLAITPLAAIAQEAQDRDSILLDPVVIAPNRMPTPERQVGSAVSIITGEDLERRQIRLVSDALRQVPGVTVGRSGSVGSQTQVRIRGAEDNQTLVLIDGVEVNDPASGNAFDFAHLLTQDVERIEVLRGPQSALYGSDAIGGVVNIITRRGEGVPGMSIQVEGGTRGTAAGSVSASGADDRADFFISLGGYRTDGFSSAAQWRGNAERDGYRNTTAFAKLGVNPTDALRLDLVGRLVDYRLESDDFIGGAGAVDADTGTRGQQMFGRAQAKLDLLEGRWQHIAGISRTHSDMDYQTARITDSTYAGEKTRLDYQTNLTLNSAELVPATHILTFVAEHEDDSATVGSEYFDFDRSIGQTGLVGQYQLGLWDDLFITGSIRHDMNDLFGDYTTWRLTSAYNIETSGTKLRGSYGTGIKNPSLFELYGYTDTYRGNPLLEPEKAKGWDVGVDQWLLRDVVMIEATYFDQRISNLIQGSGETSVNLAGTSPVHGIELGVSLTPMENLAIRAAYTWLKGEDADGIQLVRRPADSASLDIGYSFFDDRAQLDLGVIYTGGRTDIAFDEFYDQSTVELESYILVNIAGSWQLNETASLFGRVENVFDAHYEDVYTYGGTGRTAVAGLKLTF
ncbi:TonB-dependent receptor [Aureimonas fodinaquatilis]|uniref:TonB-dependent receptor n=1 Tax=Aureimonas fodinaquatilis TaxID=2565783 RepID=A0A5B0E150_9HYPH|nr:TonB-dependent receptor [Aureimonas fodinaquatilis]KAA0971691.1 TonB-dependent receptor [Aureimonas fodinaquatilis]